MKTKSIENLDKYEEMIVYLENQIAESATEKDIDDHKTKIAHLRRSLNMLKTYNEEIIEDMQHKGDKRYAEGIGKPGFARHKSRLIEHGDLAEYVDNEIADFVLGLWKLGIKTTNSCQGDEDADKFLLEFEMTEALKFLNLVGTETKRRSWMPSNSLVTIYNRLGSSCCTDLHLNLINTIKPEEVWSYRVHLDDGAEYKDPEAKFYFRVSFDIPKSDLQELCNIVEKQLMLIEDEYY